jgi:hypothetical protein
MLIIFDQLMFYDPFTSAFEVVLLNNIERFTKEIFFIHIGEFLVIAINLAEKLDLHVT